MSMRRFATSLVTACVLLPCVRAQSFVNGDFEQNTFTGCAYNLVNTSFNLGMVGCEAYGQGGSSAQVGEIDVMSGTCAQYGPIGPVGGYRLGLSYNDSTPGYDAFTLELTSPLQVGASYTVSFWAVSIAYSTSTVSPGQIEIGTSPVPGDQGTIVGISPVLGITSAGDGFELYSVTFTATTPDQYISVEVFQGNARTWNWVDGFEIQPAGGAYCTSVNGTGANPTACSCIVPPILGGAWVLDVAPGPNTLFTLLYLSHEAMEPLSLQWGELLIAPPVYSVPGGPIHPVPLPPSNTLLGFPVWAQGLLVDNGPAGLDLRLTNAQLGVLGY